LTPCNASPCGLCQPRSRGKGRPFPYGFLLKIQNKCAIIYQRNSISNMHIKNLDLHSFRPICTIKKRCNSCKSCKSVLFFSLGTRSSTVRVEYRLVCCKCRNDRPHPSGQTRGSATTQETSSSTSPGVGVTPCGYPFAIANKGLASHKGRG